MKWKLLCEGLENPAGIDTPTPELSWYGSARPPAGSGCGRRGFPPGTADGRIRRIPGISFQPIWKKNAAIAGKSP